VKPARVPVETRLMTISAGCMGESNGGTKERSDASPAIGRTCVELAECVTAKLALCKRFLHTRVVARPLRMSDLGVRG
jgi:hypothetical protein